MERAIHFVGIGGIGMSALAQYAADRGARVTGSDREESPVTRMLEQKGIAVAVPQQAENVPKDAEQVVYSDAVPADNPERARARALGIPECSYFAMLGRVSAGLRTIAVAGTHGKTTTTGMLAKILRDAHADPTAIIGSIVRDFGSNYVHGESDLFVVEACEYRDHLLELSPEVLVVTNLEWDHTDYFPSLEALQATFRRAMERVPATGAIVTNPDDPHIAPLLREGFVGRAKIVDYKKESGYELQLPGAFNKQNARAAAAAARVVLPKLTEAAIARSLIDFTGTWRRFEYKGTTPKGADVYDDYAHHPTAVSKTLEALREKTRGRIFVVFHPHLYSRTRDLMNEFAHAFADADEVVVAPIYAARELPDGATTSAALAERVRRAGTKALALDTFTDITAYLEARAEAGDAVILMGAGDIYKIAGTLVASEHAGEVARDTPAAVS